MVVATEVSHIHSEYTIIYSNSARERCHLIYRMRNGEKYMYMDRGGRERMRKNQREVDGSCGKKGKKTEEKMAD